MFNFNISINILKDNFKNNLIYPHYGRHEITRSEILALQLLNYTLIVKIF
jgi:hypothetical protein